MNHAYRLVWNDHAQRYVPAPETARSRGKSAGGKALKPLALSLAALFAGATLAGTPTATTLPQGGTVTAGSASIGQSGSRMDIDQTSQRAIIEWTGFDIGSQAQVNFNQPNAASVALNRVIAGEASQIHGQLTANGQVWLINPNGVLFGQGSRVDVGGLVASTLDTLDSDFLAGKAEFHRGDATGNVVNQGEITARDGGLVALLAPEVRNEGVIAARLGNVVLAAGDRITLDAGADGFLKVAVDPATIATLIENRHLIQADGGQVIMSAQAADHLLSSVVANTGTIQARTLENRAGRILLLADMEHGEVRVGGTLDASAPSLPSLADNSPLPPGEGLGVRKPTPAEAQNGGFIETSAGRVRIADGTQVTTQAYNGQSGTWLIDPHDYTIAASGGDISGATLSANLANGNIEIQSSQGTAEGNGDIHVNDAVSWSANTLTLTAARDININAVMTASGGSKLVMNTATANGGEAGVSGGTVKVGFAPGEANGFAGRVDFPGRSGTGFLTINGHNYTVINSLGAQGSTTGTDLQGISGNLAGYYALGAVIDASSTTWWNGGKGFKPIEAGNTYWGDQSGFSGEFDGLGHQIIKLNINILTPRDYSSDHTVGLFGATQGSAQIRNVGMVDGNINNGPVYGSLVGLNRGLISACYASGAGSVSGQDNNGGLVGYNAGTITDSYSTVNTTSTGWGSVGGLVGKNTGTIKNSYSTGQVTGPESGYGWAGGLAGINAGMVESSYSTSTVIGAQAGGLISVSWGSVSNSYSTGQVTGTILGGGLIGNNGGSVSASYSTGSVSADSNVGGLVGWNNGSIIDSLSTGSVTGSSNFGGLIGANNGSINNSHYDIDQVAVNGEHILTSGGLYTAQYQDWFDHGLSLDIANYAVTLPLVGDQYLISDILSLKDLLGFAGASGYKFRLNNNIDLGISPGFFIPYFGALAFDGAGYTVANLSVSQPGNSNLGFIGQLASGATLRNLTLEGINIAGGGNVGGFVGLSRGALENVTGSGLINGGGNVGGLIGSLASGSVTGGHSASTVTSGGYGVGGLVGQSENGGITNSYNTGAVNGGSYVGGLIGRIYGGSVSNSYNSGSVNGASYVGGLGGYGSGTTISNSYSNGTVTGGFIVGGLLGYAYVSNISNSYSTGLTTGTSYFGGLIGYDGGYNSITNSYWNTETSGQATSAGGLGLTTSQMRQQASFSGWDFDTVWRIYEGQSNPVLRTFQRDLTVTANDATRTYDGQTYSGGNGVLYSVAGAALAGTLSYAGNSQGAVNAGSYVIAPSAAMTQQDFQNWHVTFADGTLTIDPAALTLLAVGADNKSKTYGNPDPALTWQLASGALTQGDSFSGSLTRDAGENVGGYAIRQGTLTAGDNYTVDFANGLLTINPAALTVTANAASKAYDGLAYSGGNGVSYSGFVNGETSTVLGGTLAYGGSSQAATQAGSYVIAPSGLTSGNYAIAFNDGTLTITPETETLNDRQPGSGDLLRIATSAMGGNDGNDTPGDPGSGTLLGNGTQPGFANGQLSFALGFIRLPEE